MQEVVIFDEFLPSNLNLESSSNKISGANNGISYYQELVLDLDDGSTALIYLSDLVDSTASSVPFIQQTLNVT